MGGSHEPGPQQGAPAVAPSTGPALSTWGPAGPVAESRQPAVQAVPGPTAGTGARAGAGAEVGPASSGTVPAGPWLSLGPASSLGSGGMSASVLAAVKRLKPTAEAQPAIRRLFWNEAELLLRLQVGGVAGLGPVTGRGSGRGWGPAAGAAGWRSGVC